MLNKDENKISKNIVFSQITRAVIIVIAIVFLYILLYSLTSNSKNSLVWRYLFHETAFAAETTEAGTILEQSNYIINILPNKGFTFKIKVQNTGTQTWNQNFGDELAVTAAKNPSMLQHKFWLNAQTPTTSKKQVKPGETITLEFALQSPNQYGLISEHFGLTLNGRLITGTLFELPVNITQHPTAKTPKPVTKNPVTKNTDTGPSPIQTTITPSNTASTKLPETNVNDNSTKSEQTVAGIQTIQSINILESEPIVNVGLYYDETKKITVTADGEFGVYENGTKQGTYGAGTMVTIHYINGVYNLILPSGTASFSQPLTFKPLTSNTILEITSYERKTGWNSSLNDNRFKGEIQVKYNPLTDRLWAINTLMLEDYVAGITEVSNVDVPELHKVMAVISRTYALYHLLDNTRYNGFFHVTDDTDQVYRGYNSAQRMPLFTKEVESTKGRIVTLNNQLVVTPYFTQSDGQTKSYESVWGNSGIEIRHLQSVSVPQDVGKTLLGHGVGLSAQAAQRMAYLEGLDYQTILKHFYTGIEISKAY